MASPDLKQDAWYHDSVDYVLSFGFMKGTSATTFDPNSCATRAAMATVLYRMAGSPQVTGSNPVHRREGRNLVHRGCKLGLRERHREGRNGRTVRSKQSHHPPGSRNYDLPVQWGIPGADVSDEADLSSFPDSANIQPYARQPWLGLWSRESSWAATGN